MPLLFRSFQLFSCLVVGFPLNRINLHLAAGDGSVWAGYVERCQRPRKEKQELQKQSESAVCLGSKGGSELGASDEARSGKLGSIRKTRSPCRIVDVPEAVPFLDGFSELNLGEVSLLNPQFLRVILSPEWTQKRGIGGESPSEIAMILFPLPGVPPPSALLRLVRTGGFLWCSRQVLVISTAIQVPVGGCRARSWVFQQSYCRWTKSVRTTSEITENQKVCWQWQGSRIIPGFLCCKNSSIYSINHDTRVVYGNIIAVL